MELKMKSKEWDRKGWTKFENPSGEKVRKKTYQPRFINWANTTPDCIKTRKRLTFADHFIE
jgi:hypothetical protein